MKFVVKEKHKLPVKTEFCTMEVVCMDLFQSIKDHTNAFRGS